MKAEEARKVADQALTQLAEALAAGKSESLMTLLAAAAKFHRYSFSNVMLIVWQRPDATQVAGFQTWKSFGRFVKKGEKGIAIIAPMVLKKRDTSAEPDADETVLRFRAVHVFDITQTEGEPLPEPRRISGDPGHMLDTLRQFIAQRGIAMVTENLGPSVLGASRGGTIAIAAGLEPAEEFSVLVHELAHEMLHQHEQRGTASTRPGKTVRETEAEAVAFVVNTAIGLDTAASVDYIQMYRGDEKTLADSLERVQSVASLVIQALTKHSGPEQIVEGTSC